MMDFHLTGEINPSFPKLFWGQFLITAIERQLGQWPSDKDLKAQDWTTFCCDLDVRGVTLKPRWTLRCEWRYNKHPVPP